MHKPPRIRHSLQSGIALITSLIFLIVVTLIGLSAVRLITQQERTVQYTYDRGLTFQAAEAALREAEAAVEAKKPMPSASCDQITGGTLKVCPAPAPSATPRWMSSTFSDWSSATAVGTGNLSVTPQYFAEYLGNNFPCDTAIDSGCKRYRITARAGGSGRAEVMLQSVYATD